MSGIVVLKQAPSPLSHSKEIRTQKKAQPIGLGGGCGKGVSFLALVLVFNPVLPGIQN